MEGLKNGKKINLKEQSSQVFDDKGFVMGAVRRQILQGLGFEMDNLIKKPIIAIANSYTEFNPGHAHLRELAGKVKEGIWAAGAIPFEFNVPAPCDGAAMGTRGMKFVLAQRDLIADSVETYVRSQLFDGLVTISTCDKINPGMLMAAARLDLPTICVPGGAGIWNIRYTAGAGKSVDHKDYKDYRLKMQSATLSTCGACEIMGTANTFQILMEALGMALPLSATVPATHEMTSRNARKAGMRVVELVKEGITARRILNEDSLMNAVMVNSAICGSTNATLHLPALARDLGIDLPLEKFNEATKKIPTILSIAPSGPHGIIDLFKAGGAPAVMKRIKDDLNLDCLTVEGCSLGDIIKKARVTDEEVVPPREKAKSPEGSLAVLFGNLAPDGAVVKQSAVIPSMLKFTGRALIMESEADALEAVRSKKVVGGTVLVIRYEGPKGSPGMPEILALTMQVDLMQLKDVALITDGRFSGATAGPCIGHVSPEAYVGGPIALLENGDEITIDIPGRSLTVNISDEEMGKRRKQWKPLVKPVPDGYMTRYRNSVGSAAKGATLGQ